MTRLDLKSALIRLVASCLGVGIGCLGGYLFAGGFELPSWQFTLAMVLAPALLSLLPERFHARLKQPLSEGHVVLSAFLIGLAIVAFYVMFALFS